MHNRDLPGPNSVHSSNIYSIGRSKHHGAGCLRTGECGLRGHRYRAGAAIGRGRGHSALSRGDRHSHGGKKGGVFGPTGQARDRLLKERIGEGLAVAARAGDKSAEVALERMAASGDPRAGALIDGLTGGVNNTVASLGAAAASGNGAAMSELERMAGRGNPAAASALSAINKQPEAVSADVCRNFGAFSPECLSVSGKMGGSTVPGLSDDLTPGVTVGPYGSVGPRLGFYKAFSHGYGLASPNPFNTTRSPGELGILSPNPAVRSAAAIEASENAETDMVLNQAKYFGTDPVNVLGGVTPKGPLLDYRTLTSSERASAIINSMNPMKAVEEEAANSGLDQGIKNMDPLTRGAIAQQEGLAKLTGEQSGVEKALGKKGIISPEDARNIKSETYKEIIRPAIAVEMAALKNGATPEEAKKMAQKAVEKSTLVQLEEEGMIKSSLSPTAQAAYAMEEAAFNGHPNPVAYAEGVAAEQNAFAHGHPNPKAVGKGVESAVEARAMGHPNPEAVGAAAEAEEMAMSSGHPNPKAVAEGTAAGVEAAKTHHPFPSAIAAGVAAEKAASDSGYVNPKAAGAAAAAEEMAIQLGHPDPKAVGQQAAAEEEAKQMGDKAKQATANAAREAEEMARLSGHPNPRGVGEQAAAEEMKNQEMIDSAIAIEAAAIQKAKDMGYKDPVAAAQKALAEAASFQDINNIKPSDSFEIAKLEMIENAAFEKAKAMGYANPAEAARGAISEALKNKGLLPQTKDEFLSQAAAEEAAAQEEMMNQQQKPASVLSPAAKQEMAASEERKEAIKGAFLPNLLHSAKAQMAAEEAEAVARSVGHPNPIIAGQQARINEAAKDAGVTSPAASAAEEASNIDTIANQEIMAAEEAAAHAEEDEMQKSAKAAAMADEQEQISKNIEDQAVNKLVQTVKGAAAEEAEKEDLGIIGTIPDDAKSVDINNGFLKFPLKTFAKEKPRNEGEITAKKEQDQLSEDLRNKVTKGLISSPLNAIQGEDGILNIPESAKQIIVEEGTVFFPESAKEEMERAGMDVSALKHRYNLGEKKDKAMGEGYYVADASGMAMDLPSPSLKSPPKLMSGEHGLLDINKAEGMEIRKGKVEMTPWTEYSKKIRPEINIPVSKPAMPKAVENAIKDAVKAAELMSQTRKEIITNPSGKQYVKMTPPVGVSQQIEMAEAIKAAGEGLVGGRDSGQAGIGPIGEDRKPEKEKKSLNLAESEVKERTLENDYKAKAMSHANIEESARILTKRNSFNPSASKEKEKELKQAGFSEEALAMGVVGGSAIAGKFVEASAKGGAFSAQDHLNNIMHENSAVMSSVLGMSETEVLSAMEKIPKSSMDIFFEYRTQYNKIKYQKQYAKAYDNLKMIFGSKAEAALRILGSFIEAAKERSKPLRVVSTNIVNVPMTRKLPVYPKIEDIKKNHKDVDGPKIVVLKPRMVEKKVLTPVKQVRIVKGNPANQDKPNRIVSRTVRTSDSKPSNKVVIKPQQVVIKPQKVIVKP